jgi:selenocysteine lyase/cysteine desulfurase
VGARLVLDLTLSLGALPFDVGAVQPDFLFCAGYKWLLGPYGYGFLYAAEEHRAGTPIEHNWINRAGAEDFAGLVRYTDRFAPGARRYDVGEKSNFVLTPMMAAALRLVRELDPARIARELRESNAALAARTAEVGYPATAEHLRASHYLALSLDGRDAAALARHLAEARVYVSVRGDRLRVTPHLYNDAADRDALVGALARFGGGAQRLRNG